MAWLSIGSRGDEPLISEIREMRLAHERTERRIDQALQENRDEIQITREIMRRNEIAFQDFRREVNDLIEESQAQRGALLSLIDEMRGGGASPAPG